MCTSSGQHTQIPAGPTGLPWFALAGHEHPGQHELECQELAHTAFHVLGSNRRSNQNQDCSRPKGSRGQETNHGESFEPGGAGMPSEVLRDAIEGLETIARERVAVCRVWTATPKQGQGAQPTKILALESSNNRVQSRNRG